MAQSGTWTFNFKGSSSDTIFSNSAPGCDNDAPGIISEPNSSCVDGSVYHIVATNRNNARYSNGLAFSTCGSGSLSILSATFAPGGTNVGCGGELKYDCINGNCVASTIYKTPGSYNTLQDCQQSCGNNNPCPEGYECVSVQDTQKLVDCIC